MKKISRTLIFLALTFNAVGRAQLAPLAIDPSQTQGQPGTLIRAQPILFGGPAQAKSYRFLYRSTGLDGQPIIVSGMVVIPEGNPPSGGRPIVAWAHPTTGIVPRCAPSNARIRFLMIPGLKEMVRLGFVVVATDYPGLGTPGPHPYLVGVSEGRAVLDSVRSVRNMRGVGDGARFTVWGHSQGGHAALFAGLLAQSYAPDLKLLGVAVAAPATDLGTLLNADLNTPAGRNLTSMTLWSWSRVFGASTQEILNPLALATVDLLAEQCIESIYDLKIRKWIGRPLSRNFLLVNDFEKIQPWSRLLAENSPGPLPPSIPVFIAQGLADSIIEPKVTEDYMKRLCRAGSSVTLDLLPDVGHGGVAEKAATVTVAWMAARFAGLPPSSNCSE